MSLGWEELAARTLARQFPPRPAGVAEMVGLVGPMQTQTARSAFLGLAARFPGVTHEQVTAAYEAGALVRGSTIRGTVHTATPEQYAALGAATRTGLRQRWVQQLRMPDAQVEDLWAATEEFAREEWRSLDELGEHLAGWLAAHEGPEAASSAREQAGRYLACAHGGLVRRPSRGGWEGQGRAVYRTFVPPVPGTLEDLVRLHLRSHGPASRQDLAWWSGLGLTVVDRVVDSLGLVGEPGPDGRTYLDLPGPVRSSALDGVRLLPEFDALLCGYDSRARGRFVTPDHHAVLWSSANGLLRAQLLVDGRITGYWRSTGSARRRPMEVVWFAGTRRPRTAELAEPVAAVEAVLGIVITQVTTTRG